MPEAMNHGKMTWTGKFDIEGFAIFKCEHCTREIGLNAEAETPYKSINQGNVFASHSASFGGAPVLDISVEAEQANTPAPVKH